MASPVESSGGRRFIQSLLPSRMSSQASRPTTLVGNGGRMDYIDDATRTEREYGQDAQLPSRRDQQQDTGRELRREKPELVPASDQLATFRTLVGIDSAPALTTMTYFQRPAENIGIYGRVIHAESSSRMKHRIFSLLVNGCLGAQIIVSAALTALGAGNGPHKAVTAFGAINVTISGFLVYLKGSGLPNRLKYYLNEWTKVREYIEQRERDFCREGCLLDLETEVCAIENLYEEVKNDISMNTPDNFTGVADLQRKREDLNPRPPLARGMSYQGRFAEAQHPVTQSERRFEPGLVRAKDREKSDTLHMV